MKQEQELFSEGSASGHLLLPAFPFGTTSRRRMEEPSLRHVCSGERTKEHAQRSNRTGKYMIKPTLKRHAALIVSDFGDRWSKDAEHTNPAQTRALPGENGLFRICRAQPLCRSTKKPMENGIEGCFYPKNHFSPIE